MSSAFVDVVILKPLRPTGLANILSACNEKKSHLNLGFLWLEDVELEINA
jgi:hypothetical protein